MRPKIEAFLIEALGGALMALAALGVIILVLGVYLPWIWRMHIENAKWLSEKGEKTWLVRATLWLDERLKLIRG